MTGADVPVQLNAERNAQQLALHHVPCLCLPRCQRQTEASIVHAVPPEQRQLARVRHNVKQYAHFRWPDVEGTGDGGAKVKYKGPAGKFWTEVTQKAADGTCATASWPSLAPAACADNVVGRLTVPPPHRWSMQYMFHTADIALGFSC